jgi:cytochrome c-type biogenesis protein CcmH/NrfF
LKLKRALLGFTLAGLTFAQTESQISGPEVERVGKHIQCQCGSCKENLNCNMSAHQCHFCKPARTEIFKQQQQGKSDSEIIASFVQQYGQKIFLSDPNSSFWLVPYFSLAAGGVLVWFVLRRMRAHAQAAKPALATAGGPPIPEDAEFARYRDSIERDTEQLN